MADALGPPVGFGLALVVVWELFITIFSIDTFLLPRPTAIAGALISERSGLIEAGLETAKVAVSGLVIGVLVGVGLAFVITRFRSINAALTPLAVALNATPIIALAPIFNAWFGITGYRSNQSVVIVVVFFPVFINTARGLSEVDPRHIELMRSYAASEWTILRRVRIPNGLPFLLTSLRVAAPFSVIAAIVAEYFGGPQNRLGPFITQNASFARSANVWAAIMVASLLGLALFALVLRLERVAMPWRRSEARS